MEDAREQRTIYELFRLSVLVKGAISLAEVIAGIVILCIPGAMIIALGAWLSQSLASVPSLSAQIVKETAHYGSSTAHFLSIYLVSRGLIKVLLIWALLKNKLWAYPTSLVALTGFVLYQIYQIITTHSVLVIGITLFDFVVMYFIWREYRIVRAKVLTH